MEGSKKRILLVGNGDAQFVIHYADWLNKLGNDQFEVDILSFNRISERNLAYYHKVYSYPFGRLKPGSQAYRIRRAFNAFRLMVSISSRLKSYDFVHLHYVDFFSYLIALLIPKSSRIRIIASVWGSDMYRAKGINRFGFSKIIRKAHRISLANPESMDYFKSHFAHQENSVRMLRFGLKPLEYLMNIDLSREDAKKELGWNSNKLAIVIGYNLQLIQQHLLILDQFSRPELIALADRIQLVLPLTYAGTQSYKEQIIQKLKSLPFEYTLYEKYLSDEEVAKIRIAADVLIQLQTHDQLSGSMQEHLFASSVVITGSWLPYRMFKEEGVWFLEIDQMEDLAKLMSEVIANYPLYLAKTNNCKEVIGRLSLWENNIRQWMELYS
jgi:hypothetical protein